MLDLKQLAKKSYEQALKAAEKDGVSKSSGDFPSYLVDELIEQVMEKISWEDKLEYILSNPQSIVDTIKEKTLELRAAKFSDVVDETIFQKAMLSL